MNKKLLLCIAIVMMCASRLSAQVTVKQWYLVADNTTYLPINDVDFLLSTNDDPALSVVKKDGSVIYPVIEITFSQSDPTGIDEVVSGNSESSMKVRLVDSQITLQGLREKTDARVYSSGGALLINAKLNPGDATIDVTGLEAGVYVLKVNKAAVKFIKK